MTWTPYAGDAYLHYDAVESFCRELAAAHPDVVSLDELGLTEQGRPLLLLTLGDRSGDPDSRPAFWVDGGTHASEWAGVMSVLDCVSRWVTGMITDDSTRAWFRSHTVYALPCISPDGFQRMLDGSPFIRSHLRPPPAGTVRIGLESGDLDGDGAVRWMRWRSPAGSFVADEEQPLLMRPRRLDDDAADAWMVAPEGRFLRWDGHRWTGAPRQFGLDLNRNFPGSWKRFSMFGMDGGEVPMAVPESRLTVDALRARRNVSAAVTNHTYTGALLCQPYREPSPLTDSDIDVMKALGDDAVRGTGWRAINVQPDFVYDPKQSIHGVWSDTLATLFGVAGYTLEIWDPFGHAGIEVDKPGAWFMKPDPSTIRAMVDAFADEPTTKSWTAFDHPQLGPVEIGGIDRMLTVRNPPVRLLKTELDKAFTVIDRARRAVPRLRGELVATELGAGVHKVELRLENLGFLSSCGLERAETVGVDPGIHVALTIQPGQSVDGERERSLPHVDGWGTTRVGSSRNPLYVSLPSRGSRVATTWVVTGGGAVSARWTSARAGSGELSAEL